MNPVITELHEKIATLRSERDRAEERVADAENEVTILESEVSVLESTICELERELEGIEDSGPKPNWPE